MKAYSRLVTLAMISEKPIKAYGRICTHTEMGATRGLPASSSQEFAWLPQGLSL